MQIEPLQADTVRVRWLATEAAGRFRMQRWRAMLDATELARADSFRFAADRETFTAAHALTRAMLSGATGWPTETWRYVNGEFGKPALAEDCQVAGRSAMGPDGRGGALHFNLSHTRGFVACAIAHHEVGVDVEASDRPVELAIADRDFAPEEVRALACVPAEQKAALFFRFWTLKEAFIKASGTGLTRSLDGFSFAFDPLRISVHPERDAGLARDDPAAWQFFECQAAVHRPVALAVRRTGPGLLRLEARAAQPSEVGGGSS